MYFAKLLLFQVTLILIGVAQAYEKYKIVETDNGQIRGVRNVTLLNGHIFYSFKGIPYAKAPTGSLRFKAPEPAEPWKPKILDAFQYGNKCLEPVIYFCYEYPMNEDCLSLNIFVPADVKPDEKMAVLFMIHGGSYRAGSGDDFFFGPDFIVEKQTILVTINYRLGMLGFLALNSTEYSGNMGLKDQQLALKWIHSNIHHFGGDNKRITIIGQSAGAASVNFHILSADSRKYFHNAIVMSGSSENLWAMSIEDNHIELAHQIAREYNKTNLSFDELVEFLKEAPIESYFHWSMIIKFEHDVFLTRLAAVIERPDAKQPFLLDSPQKLYESSKIDIDAMFTVTETEMFASIAEKSKEHFEAVNANFSEFIMLPFRDLNVHSESDKNVYKTFETAIGTEANFSLFLHDEHRPLTEEIREFYFGNTTITMEDSLITYLEMMSDINMFLNIDQSVKRLASVSKGKVYYMMFAVDSKLNSMKNGLLFDHMVGKPGVSHGDDLCYLFRCDKIADVYDEILLNNTDKHSKIALQTIEYMTKLFTNFAKYGDPAYQNDPIDEFPPVQNDRTHYLLMNNEGLSLGINLRQKYVDFWNKIRSKALELSNDERQNEIDAD